MSHVPIHSYGFSLHSFSTTFITHSFMTGEAGMRRIDHCKKEFSRNSWMNGMDGLRSEDKLVIKEKIQLLVNE